MRIQASGIGPSQRAAKATAASLRPVFLVALVAVAAIFIRYGSFDPCDWAMHELSEKSGVPVRLALMLANGGPVDMARANRARCLDVWGRSITGTLDLANLGEPAIPAQTRAEPENAPAREEIDPAISAKIDAAVARQKALILAEEREKSAAARIDPAMQARIDRAEARARAALDKQGAK